MDSKSNFSFVNGLIAGAGAVLALMSYGFLQFVAGLENIQGVTTTELRVAIMLGGIVSAVAIGYEFYDKKKQLKGKKKKLKKKKIDEKNPTESSTDPSVNE